jgi:cell wall-associated NlpC family hydrolase
LRLLRVGPWARVSFIALALALIALPASALGAGGGITPTTSDNGEPATASTPTPESTECTTTTAADGSTETSCKVVKKARLVQGVAAAPASAPPAIKAAIAAANRIRTKPYIWGGGHARWWSPGYDCSGAVSYALHGAGLLSTPMDSGEMMSYGAPGKGRWITIYANAGHAFAVVDGIRWDTAGDTSGTGPRWHRAMTSTAGFVARHPVGY